MPEILIFSFCLQIERLCDRLQSSLLIEDRRDSLKTIKSLSKKFKLDVGTQAMHVLIEVLKQNKMDSELCCLALDTLFNIVDTSEHSKEEPDAQANNKEQQEQVLPADISAQFSEMFVKDKSNVELLFELLDEFEFQVRWSTIKLLNALILNLTAQIQDIILQNPRSTGRIIDLLTDSREVIRNDVSFYLLFKIFKENVEMIRNKKNFFEIFVSIFEIFELKKFKVSIFDTSQRFFSLHKHEN